jgi:hypothetical protein
MKSKRPLMVLIHGGPNSNVSSELSMIFLIFKIYN